MASNISWLKRQFMAGKVDHPLLREFWPYLAKRTDSPLQRAAARLTRLERTGGELAGPCPLCAGRLIVGRTSWRCLGCGAQEVSGDDQAGLDAAYATMRNDEPEKG